MMILNSRGVVFIHLHKCAGSAVEASLAPLLRWNDILLGSTPAGDALQRVYLDLFGLHKHSSAAEVKAVIGDATWSSAFTFATVRNPYERAASLFNFVASDAEPRLAAVGFPREDDHAGQRRWVDEWTTHPHPFWSSPATQAYLRARGAARPFSTFVRQPALLELELAFRPQLSQLADDAGHVLVDEVVKAEELARHWPRICERIGAPELPLLTVNATPAEFRRGFDALTDDPEDARFLERRFRDDFLAFGYPMRRGAATAAGG